MRWLVAVFLSLAAVAVVESTYYCNWKHWGAWSACSAKCGQGKEYRERLCDMQTYCEGCQGDNKQSRDCNGRGSAKTKWVKSKSGCQGCKQQYDCVFKDSSCQGTARCGKDMKTWEYRTCGACCKCEWIYSKKVKGKCFMKDGQCKIEKKRSCKCKPKDCPANCNKREPKQYAPCPYQYSDNRNTCPPPAPQCKCYYTHWRQDGNCYKNRYGKCKVRKIRDCHCNYKDCDCDGAKEAIMDCPNQYGCGDSYSSSESSSDSDSKYKKKTYKKSGSKSTSSSSSKSKSKKKKAYKTGTKSTSSSSHSDINYGKEVY